MTPRVARRPSRPANTASAPSSSLSFARSTDPLRIERRRALRLPASGDLVATFRGGDGRVGLTSVEMIDASDGGMGLRSPVAIEPGMIVTLRDARTRQPWSDARAVRCYRDGAGYRVGLELTHRLAA